MLASAEKHDSIKFTNEYIRKCFFLPYNPRQTIICELEILRSHIDESTVQWYDVRGNKGACGQAERKL